MTEILHANIFFIIASIATIVFCVLVAIALYQLIKILRITRNILERIESGSEQIAHDFSAVRTYVANGGIFGRILQFFFTRSAPRKRRDSQGEQDDEE